MVAPITKDIYNSSNTHICTLELTDKVQTVEFRIYDDRERSQMFGNFIPVQKDNLKDDTSRGKKAAGITKLIKKAYGLTEVDFAEIKIQVEEFVDIYKEDEETIELEIVADKKEAKEDQTTTHQEIVNAYPDEIREMAELLLNESDAFNFILETWQLRHVGDEIVGKNCLCAAASTYISNTNVGSHLKPSGESGKGKSSGIETFLECLPPRKYISGSMSAKSAFYDNRLKPGMIRYCDDAHLNDDMIATVKQSTSNFQKPTEHHTVKLQESHTCLIPERVSWWFTSVDSFDDDQLANRFLNADVDGSAAQDKAVADFILKSEKALFSESDEDIQVCRCVYDMLDDQTYNILIPYAECIEWNNPENRRNLTKFLDMIRAVAFYNIKQRESMTIKNGQETVYFATIDDYFRALEIYQVNAGKNATNLSEKEMKIFQFFAANVGKPMKLKDIAKKIKQTEQSAKNTMEGREKNGGLLAKIIGLSSEQVSDTVTGSDGITRSTRYNTYTYTGTNDLKIWDTSISKLDTEKCKEVIANFKESIAIADSNTNKHDSNTQMFESKPTTRERIINYKTKNNNNIYRDKNTPISSSDSVAFSHKQGNSVCPSKNKSDDADSDSNNAMFESVCECLSGQDKGKFEKVSHFVEKFQREYGSINKTNLKDATHLISSWSKVKPSETKPIIEKLCSIA